MKNYRESMSMEVRRVLDQEHLSYHFDEEKGCFDLKFCLKEKSNTAVFYLLFYVKQREIVVYITAELSEEERNFHHDTARVYELINLINCEITRGRFGMYEKTGQIYFCLELDYEQGELSEKIRAVLKEGPDLYFLFYPGFSEIVRGKMSAEEVLVLCAERYLRNNR